MRKLAWLMLAGLLLAAGGCGRARLAGRYRAEIRLVEGKQESKEPGYSLAAVRARAGQRTLTLHASGRYEWHTGDSVSQGNWRVEGDTLILRDDTYNETHILPALQKDRRWRLGDHGEIVNDGAYSHYNLQEVYTRVK